MSVARKTIAKVKQPARPRAEKADAKTATTDIARRYPKILAELGK